MYKNLKKNQNLSMIIKHFSTKQTVKSKSLTTK